MPWSPVLDEHPPRLTVRAQPRYAQLVCWPVNPLPVTPGEAASANVSFSVFIILLFLWRFKIFQVQTAQLNAPLVIII